MESIHYFFPLTKRARLIIKIKSLLDEFCDLQEKADSLSSKRALESIFELLQLIERIEIKMELAKESEKFMLVTLDEKILSLKKDIAELLNTQGKVGENLRANPSLQLLQKRLILTGGACEFDTPSLHSWLEGPTKLRKHDLNTIYLNFELLHKAIISIVKGYNDYIELSKKELSNGIIQINPKPQSSIIVIKIPNNKSDLYPEVSLSLKAVFIKIWSQKSLLEKNIPYDGHLELEIGEF